MFFFYLTYLSGSVWCLHTAALAEVASTAGVFSCRGMPVNHIQESAQQGSELILEPLSNMFVAVNPVVFPFSLASVRRTLIESLCLSGEDAPDRC